MRKKSWLTVESVSDHSPASNKGIEQGDHLLEINGYPIHDLIDFQFYSAEEDLDCRLIREGQEIEVSLHRELHEDLGLHFGSMCFRYCGNHCIFCFIDQNPKGMRRSLYLKDEDYRLSFLTGHYVTLTNVSRQDLNRIVEQRLSPLYISIHVTRPEIRKTLLGLKGEDFFLEKIEFLAAHGIEMHGQIVLCPGINDGSILKETIVTLEGFFPNLRSLACVPVGTTRYRDGLFPLKPYDDDLAARLIQEIAPVQKGYRKRFQESFIYLADEFYLLSGKELPGDEHYNDFWQIENGVGMTRAFCTNFFKEADCFPRKLSHPRNIVLITGTLAKPVITGRVLPILNRIQNLNVRVQPVMNKFFGTTVTVSGLLTGKDILLSMQKEKSDGEMILPSNCINESGCFLDDMKLGEIEAQLNRKVNIIRSFREIFI